jgi:RNA polymerase sigma-70 factor (ECF subfamily)
MSGLAVADGVMADLEPFRGELTGYCYRMLGSTFDADDAVQETLVKAWQSMDRFEGRSSLRSWLYRIATNVCLDALRSRQRRAVPMDMMEPRSASLPPSNTLPEDTWLEPVPNAAIDPAELTERSDTIRLAFVAALQHLPARQRAVLILREVLAWQAAEVAELLDTTVVSVNSALQRARATLAERDLTTPAPVTAEDRELLARYVAAFEAYDIAGLVSLLHEDASMSMPPFAMWLRGADEMRTWYLGYGSGCEDSRMLPCEVNGMLSIAQYKPDPAGGHQPWAIHVLETSGGRISHIHHFIEHSSLDPDAPEAKLFQRFGLPAPL